MEKARTFSWRIFKRIVEKCLIERKVYGNKSYCVTIRPFLVKLVPMSANFINVEILSWLKKCSKIFFDLFNLLEYYQWN